MAEKKPGLLKRIFSFGFGRKKKQEESEEAEQTAALEAPQVETVEAESPAPEPVVPVEDGEALRKAEQEAEAARAAEEARIKAEAAEREEAERKAEEAEAARIKAEQEAAAAEERRLEEEARKAEQAAEEKRVAAEAKAAAEKEAAEKAEKERAEAKRLKRQEAERQEAEKLKAEKRAAELAEAEKAAEKERLEKLAAEKKAAAEEKARLEAEQKQRDEEAASKEAARKAEQALEQQRFEEEAAEAKRLQAEAAEAERIAKEEEAERIRAEQEAAAEEKLREEEAAKAAAIKAEKEAEPVTDEQVDDTSEGLAGEDLPDSTDDIADSDDDDGDPLIPLVPEESKITLTERKRKLPEPELEPEADEDSQEERRTGWLKRLGKGLSRSSSALTENITKVFTDRKLDDETLQDLEDILIQADLGVETAMKITDALSEQKFGKTVSDEEVRAIMAAEIEKILEPVAQDLDLDLEHQPHVILVIGVNGSGKTTTIGKLAAKLYDAGFSTSLVAGDTFRAAAIEQLKIWGERTQSPVLYRPLGSDAAGLAYDAWEKAREERRDVMLMDTAGRLQNRTELMAELEKIVRVLKKQDPEAPHTVLLTLDATTGQNALNQVEIFTQIAGVNGIVMTKLDGTARGGILVAISAKYKLPVYFVGVGEQVEDLEPFEARDFARSIAGLPREE